MINFSEEGIVVALSYLIPGFLINTILARVFKLDNSTNVQSLYKFLLLSVLNIFVFSIIDKVSFQIFGKDLIQDSVIILCLRNVVLPIVCALAFLVLTKKIKLNGLSFKNLMGMLGFDGTSRTDSAWDYIFDNLDKGSYVIIKLKSGEYIYGLYDSKSFVSYKTSGSNSIYLEQTFKKFDGQDPEATGYGILIYSENIEALRVDASRVL